MLHSSFNRNLHKLIKKIEWPMYVINVDRNRRCSCIDHKTNDGDIHCPNCHSQHVWDINSIGQGKELTYEELDKCIEAQKLVSCILFFGGEWDLEYLKNIIKYIQNKYDYKIALYSGHDFDFFSKNKILELLNYIKVGPYVESLGGLSNPKTNQKLYYNDNGIYKDITYKFWNIGYKHENV